MIPLRATGFPYLTLIFQPSITPFQKSSACYIQNT